MANKPYTLFEELIDRNGNVVKSIRLNSYATREEAISASYEWSHPDHNSIQLTLCKLACGCFEENSEVVVSAF